MRHLRVCDGVAPARLSSCRRLADGLRGSGIAEAVRSLLVCCALLADVRFQLLSLEGLWTNACMHLNQRLNWRRMRFAHTAHDAEGSSGFLQRAGMFR